MLVWFFVVRFVERIGWVMTLLIRLLILVDGGSVLLSLMLVVTCLGFVVAGTLLFLTFIDSSLPFLVQLSIKMVVRVLLLILWYGLLVLVLKGVGWFMLFGTGYSCPGQLAFGIRSGFMFLHLLSVLMMLLIGLTPLVFWLSGLPFLRSLHWPVGGLDLGVGGVSYAEFLILYELLAGERLSLEKACPRFLGPGRPISVSAVPFGPGIDIWRSCRFIGAMMRSLCLLPGGLRRFVPCSIGANHCRLRQSYWVGKEWSWSHLSTKGKCLCAFFE